MGIIRKTLSVTTLGLVGWKSKKELLAEAEADLATTRAELEATSTVRSKLQERLEAAEHRLSATELESLRDAKAARRNERWKLRRKKLESATKDAEARGAKLRKQAEARAEDARARAEEARARLEGASKSARKSARKAAKEARKRAEHFADDAREKISH